LLVSLKFPVTRLTILQKREALEVSTLAKSETIAGARTYLSASLEVEILDVENAIDIWRDFGLYSR
jgi:hypothetical protein